MFLTIEEPSMFFVYVRLFFLPKAFISFFIASNGADSWKKNPQLLLTATSTFDPPLTHLAPTHPSSKEISRSSRAGDSCNPWQVDLWGDRR
jgi:hypothetical protein